jgi:hypothetical protein
MTTYQIIWDNGHATGTLAETFTSEKAAEQFARNWKREMVALETTVAGRQEAREAYQWIVGEIEEANADDEDCTEEQSLDYFNHYIAGDR